MMNTFKLIISILLLIIANPIFSQDSILNTIDYSQPKIYEIEEITITGVQYLDTMAIKSMSGLVVGEKISIPGDIITRMLKKFWEQGLFSDVKVSANYINGDKISLNLYLKERPRLNEFKIEGIKKSEKKEIEEKLSLKQGSQITENLVNNAKTIIKDYYIEKGYFYVEVESLYTPLDGSENMVDLSFIIKKNERIKIADILFEGNIAFEDARLRRAFKKTHRRDWNIFKSSKYIEEEYKADKIKLQEFYNKRGYRDFKILSDSFSILSNKRIILHINVHEGNKYYFGNIIWIGNTKYSNDILDQVLGIKSGDIFDQELLDKRISIAEDAVSSLYLDNGYLFFSATPVETRIHNDSIDFEIRIYEGKQARINNVIIKGNTKTNEHVVRREIRTLPGELFSKSDIIRTVRELAALGHFEPEKIEPNPLPNPAEGNVDLEYKLVERANDQLEVSGGYGAKMFIGTIGLRFSNFSARSMFKPKAWRPIPSGDGQTLSIRAQSNGTYYRSFNISFVEPWFGGKKPNSFSVSLFRSRIAEYSTSLDIFSNKNPNYMLISGGSIGLGRRLTWPDDFFTLYNELSYQNYYLNNYANYFSFSNGSSNNISFTTTLSRSSTNSPIYPKSGSKLSISIQLTPPYSLFDQKDYYSLSESEKFRWIEYNKWTFKSDYYLRVIENFVILTRAQFGMLARYNSNRDYSPFESFDVGGDGWSTYNMYGRELVGLRGYKNNSLTPRLYKGNVAPISDGLKSGNIYNKLTVEFRYPITLKEQATVFALLFAEGGNCWHDFSSFNPYDIKRSAGVGLRAFLPMFGLLGIDWGYGFDNIIADPTANKSQFHFTLGQQF